ncbi:hypothetical protein [Hyphococcus sp.]|jgi:hypothetical protein|uniref:hypothetical protein n=1 Tax=Hyphococcus sp. TaxID=2038636 RepID=UPI0035C74F8F
MIKRLRIAVLLAAALLFGSAQAACACAPYKESASEAHHLTASHDGEHAAHAQHAEHQPALEHETAPSHDCGDSDPCGFHNVHQLVADTLAPQALVSPVKSAAFVILPAEPEVKAPRLTVASGFPLVSRAPPPRLSPVAMKIRLLT